MSKLKLDQYFTSPDIAEHCFKKTLEVIGEDNISEFIESSSGEGVFINQIEKYTPSIPYKAYDIDVMDERVIEQDFLLLNKEYVKNSCIIGNPPFGRSCNLAVQFFKKSINLGDYVSFILPISQLNNTYKFYEFDLIYSEDLFDQIYTNKKVHCCLNIYKRNINGLNKRINTNFNDLEIKISERTGGNRDRIITKDSFNYDIRFCIWGSVGKQCEYEHQYSKEMCIKINNNKYKEHILKLLREVKWVEIYQMTNVPNLLKWQVYKYLKEMIPELE